jgi:zinc protease
MRWMLSGVLDGHASARLNKSLVRERGWQRSRRRLRPGRAAAYSLDGTPAEGKTVGIWSRCARKKIKQDRREVRRVKAQIV